MFYVALYNSSHLHLSHFLHFIGQLKEKVVKKDNKKMSTISQKLYQVATVWHVLLTVIYFSVTDGINLLHVGVLYFVVKRIQRTCVKSRLCTKPTDSVEVSINGESDRIDRPLLPCPSHGHESRWADSCFCSGR